MILSLNKFECMQTGYYGNSQSQTFNESSNSGQDYLAEVCREWEAAAQQAKTKRVVIVRTGIVLAKEGGALAKMLPIFNIFAGGPLGNGQQWCSWVHRWALLFWVIIQNKNKIWVKKYEYKYSGLKKHSTPTLLAPRSSLGRMYYL